MRSSYGSMYDGDGPLSPYHDHDNEEFTTELSPMADQLPQRQDNHINRRWSVLDKIDNRHYLRIRTWKDFRAALNCKVLLSIVMLISFVWLAYSIIKTLFLAGFDSNRHDYIIIGGGPAGALLARKLSDHVGINVLLLEAGLGTQYSLAGKDTFGGPVTRFDIPLFWPTATSIDNFQWPDIPLPLPSTSSIDNKHDDGSSPEIAPFSISLCKGLGGCGIHNAMIYVRALPWDIRQWNLTGEADSVTGDSSSSSSSSSSGSGISNSDEKSGEGEWTWERVLSHYTQLERYEAGDVAVSTAPPSSEVGPGGLHRHMLDGGDVTSYRTKEYNARIKARRVRERSKIAARRRRTSAVKTSATNIVAGAAATAIGLSTGNSVGADTGANGHNNDHRVPYHGYDGVVTTSATTIHDPVSSLFLDAAVAAGIPYTADFNDPGCFDREVDRDKSSKDNSYPRTGRIGVGYYQFNIANGTRQSVAHVMLGSILNNGVGGNTTTSMVAEGHQSARDVVTSGSGSGSGSAVVDAETAETDTGVDAASAVESSGSDDIGEATGDQQLNMVPRSISITTSSTDPSRPRGDLNIILGATVRRILLEPTEEFNFMDTVDRATKGLKGDVLDGEDIDLTVYKAVGVEYEMDGVVKVAHLRRPSLKSGSGLLEDFRSIILTAGAIMTPKVLMNSGIGPKDVLDSPEIPIPVLIDSPRVGKGMYDHPVVALTARIDHRKLPFPYPSAYMFPMEWYQYITEVRKSLASGNTAVGQGVGVTGSTYPPPDYGVLGSPGFSTGAFLRSPYAEHLIADPSVPDIQITLFPNIIEPEVFARTQQSDSSGPDSLSGETDCIHINTDGSSTTAGTAACDGDSADRIPDIQMDILFTVALLTPEGHYEVVLNKENPLGRSPVVQLPTEGVSSKRYLTSLDTKRLRWGLEQVRAVLRTEPLSSVVVEEVSPAHEAEWNDDQLEDWIHLNHYPNNHWVGTARMGPTSGGVVGNSAATNNSNNNTSTNDDTDPTNNIIADDTSTMTTTGGDDITNSVLDENLIVRGTTNLYVADASAIPVIPNGNVHSTVTVVASMAAEIILRKLKFFSALL